MWLLQPFCLSPSQATEFMRESGRTRLLTGRPVSAISRFFLGFRHGYSVRKQVRLQAEVARMTLPIAKSGSKSAVSEFFSRVGKALPVVLCLFVAGGLVAYYGNKSGLLPRTRKVVVHFEASKWVAGELKTCYSFPPREKREPTSLFCDTHTDESHVLKVTFWGTITTGLEVWKCKRGQASVTCKLQ
jgi:hypothetical protein